jgi:hypothetical protein
VPVRVLPTTGATTGVPLPVELQHGVPSCPRLPQLAVFKLTAGQTYQVVVGPTTVERVGLVLEKLADFEAPVYRDGDGDGHGSAAVSRVTACKPPAGFVATDDDCDDGAPAVFAMCAADGPAAPPEAGTDVAPPPDLADAAAPDHPPETGVEAPVVTADAAPVAADLAPPPLADARAVDATAAPVKPSSGGGGGCSLGPPRPRRPGGFILLVGVLAGLLVARSRRKQGRPRSAAWSR